jgi:nicotinate phosphoribosyltransferase
MRDGTRLVDPRETADIAEYARRRLASLPDEHQRFENPHIYKVGLSERLLRARDKAITAHQT